MSIPKHGFLLLVFAAVSACGNDRMTWTEEAILHDGTVVKIFREAERAPSGFPNARRGRIFREALRYPQAGVAWESRSPNIEALVSFDVIDGAAWLVTIELNPPPAFCNGRAAGTPIAKVTRWLDGNASIVDVSKAPIDRMNWNLSGINHWATEARRDRKAFSLADVRAANLVRDIPTPLRSAFENPLLRCK